MGDDKKQDNADFLDDFVVTIKKNKSDEDIPKLPELKRLPATIKQIKKKNPTKGSTTVRVQFTFTIASGKYKGQYAWGSVPLHAEVTEKANLYKWMCNILRQDSIDVDDTVRIGDLVGKTVDIMIKNTTNNGKVWQNVTEVLAPCEDDVVEEETTEVSIDEEEEAVEKEEKKPAAKKQTKKAEKAKELDVEEETSDDEISEDDLPF